VEAIELGREMDAEADKIRNAMEALVQAALDSLREIEISPQFGRLPDNQRWWRDGQESFIGRRPEGWLMSDTVTHYRWLERMPQMAAVRYAFAADPVLGPRVEGTLGTEWFRQPKQLGWTLVEHVIEPMVLATRTYDFDQAIFDDVLGRFIVEFGAAELRMVEFVPLNGFDSSESSLELPGGVVVQQMTDPQVSSSIDYLAVPRMYSGAPNRAHVSRFDQWAVTVSEAHQVMAGYIGPDNPTPPVFPQLTEPADRVVTALRIVCGGSVVATRSMSAQAEDEFPFAPGTQANWSTFDAAENQRPTILTGDQIGDVLRTYNRLAGPAVKADGPLQMAIRRLVFAGCSRRDEDRIVDLMICAEALLLKRAGMSGSRKGGPLAQAAAHLLGGDKHLGASAAQVEAFLVETYQARNVVMHGDHSPHPGMILLSGEPTGSLPLVIADVERVMRRAVLLTLDGITTQAG